jgi:uncharacterized protein YggE
VPYCGRRVKFLSSAVRIATGTVLLSVGLQAQVSTRPFVQAAGSATVYAAADQATIDATVSTIGTSAQDAASKNAAKMTALLSAVGQLLGSGANLTTVNYYITPNYQSMPAGGVPTITGYTANSTVEMTLNVITLAGSAIDTAVANGASSVGGISYSLKDTDTPHRQALGMATVQALAHANSMANSAGHSVGMVLSIQEGTTSQVFPIGVGIAGAAGAAATPTPVQPGLIQVQANVTVTAELN